MSSFEERLSLIERPSSVKKGFIILFVTSLIVGSGIFAEFSIVEIILNSHKSLSMIGRLFFPPDFAYYSNIITPLLETIQMAIVGSFVGALTAIPFAVFAARNFIKVPIINQITKTILNIFRTIPSLVLASLFVAIFGIGSFPGILALSIFTFGLVSKLTYESIESIDEGQVEAMTSVGAGKLTIFRYAFIPQVLPQFMSYSLYAFEVNIRAAAVLGYVGAGGIGQTYEYNLAWRRFDNVGMIIIMTFSVVLLIDAISSAIRRRLV